MPFWSFLFRNVYILPYKFSSWLSLFEKVEKGITMGDVFYFRGYLSFVNLWNYKCCIGICTFLSMMGRCSMYRCCVQLFIMIHLVPIIIHKSTGMCIIVAFRCCIDILNCISKKLFTLISMAAFCHLPRKSLKICANSTSPSPDCFDLRHPAELRSG